ncbi:hypothetical protein ACFLTH_00725 [Bacteroidota bacterium]
MFGEIQITEYIGYVGSLLVAVSLMMRGIVKLRIINLLGAMVFSTYGFLIGALPVGFLNLFITLVDIYYLIDIYSAKEYFKILEVRQESNYLKYFCEFHSEEINKFQPSFSFNVNKNWKAYYILRNTIPAGLVIISPKGEYDLMVHLDYAIPGYRDFKMGKYVFRGMLSENGIRKIYSNAGNKAHEKYLLRIGFQKDVLNDKDIYSLKIS